MRINLPVTQREYDFPADETLVSTTDLDSRITYCNAAFVHVSGYAREDLIGQPHNLVRHPDMPAEAFRDMWATLQGGQPWSAMVKNRRKDGDHYWVVANVTPIVEAGKPVGYMSVRTRPSRPQVQQAEALYAAMRAQAAAGAMQLGLKGGVVVRAGWRGWLRRAADIGLTGQAVLGMSALLVLASAAEYLLGDMLGSGGLAWDLLFHLAVVLGSAMAAAMWVRTKVTGPLGRLATRLNRMAAGDLSQTAGAASADELGRVMLGVNQLNVNLQAIVGDVRFQVDGLKSISQDIASGNDDLSARTESQAGQLQKTAASMVELTATVRQNADNATAAAQLGGDASAAALRGSDAVAEAVRTMEAIDDTAKRVSAILGTIDSIAFQTNILALNAAVEAARAGDHGRGFAVVASEVRALSQRTAGAAREIKALLDESSRRSGEGVAAVHGAGERMAVIGEVVGRVTQLVGAISQASVEQASGVEQVSSSVSALELTTQQNAALVEQSAAVAGVLADRAKGLTQAVEIFRVRSSAGS